MSLMLGTISNLIGIIATFVAAIFLLSYLLFFKWWKTWAGSAVGLLMASLLAFGVYSVASTLLGPNWALRETFHLYVNLGMLIAVTWLTITLWFAWHRPSRPFTHIPTDLTVPGATTASTSKDIG